MAETKKRSTNWCLQADLTDYFEEANKVKIDSSKMKMFFEDLDEGKFNETVTQISNLLPDILPGSSMFFDIKQRMVKIIKPKP